MKTLTVKKLIIPAVVAAIMTGCAGLEKPKALLEAEKAYDIAAKNPNVQKYASSELSKASATLVSAAVAESAEDMASLAYIGNTQVEAAIQSAAAQQANQNSRDLLAQKDELITASIAAKKEQAQQQLLALQAREAERKILSAFKQIEFVTGTADLVPGATKDIDALVNYMSQYPTKTVAIEGHTDSSGSAKLNKKLSQERANFIRDVLISKGIAADRITSIGYGQSQPIAANTNAAGRQKNRRIELNFN
jgi:outer membrane protein OmpA-like peptidoglycan-associated protein